MPEPNPSDQGETDGAEPMLLTSELLTLNVTLDLAAGAFGFEWSDRTGKVAARGRLFPSDAIILRAFFTLHFEAEQGGNSWRDRCNGWPASVRALVNRIRKRLPVAPDGLRIGLLSDANLGMARAGRRFPIALPAGEAAWKWLAGEIMQFARALESKLVPEGSPLARGQLALRLLACALLGLTPSFQSRIDMPGPGLLNLRVTFDQVDGLAELAWTDPQRGAVVATDRIRCTGGDQLTWDLEVEGRKETQITSHARKAIRAEMKRRLEQFPTNAATVTGFWRSQKGNSAPTITQEPPFGPDESVSAWIEDNIVAMAKASRFQFSPMGATLNEIDPWFAEDYERIGRRLARREQKRAEQEARRGETMARLAEERRQREKRKAEAKAAKETGAASQSKSHAATLKPGAKEHPPAPAVPAQLELPPLVFQETTFPLSDLRAYWLRERAALWWVSNQSDDLLSLPHCRIERLEYQLRTALRVLGPLRGRALLSDEVGLGKTIEAGLVIKELLTRGMVKRFLVLTVPSLVDQWEEELSEKFGLTTVTTNQAAAREPQQFWRANAAIVASLHTLKQPAQLEVARQVHWDILIVDEAHHLRNRDSQSWQAVNALSRQFLLLLTATPVQNSLEELYNLVTLLQPGQLPSPKEFRARFINPKRPRQPREPEELRRLLGQVMIRNTRANAGVQLPPRRAETVLFEPEAAESAFWQKWEAEFRAILGRFNGSQASLWGRLLLQAAGSSPAAWRKALAKFPDATAAAAWREQAPLADSWQKKCGLIPPLTHSEGGAVVFTQFLDTQTALAEFLRGARVETFVINGATPAAERQPRTEEFRQRGGALLLTHSGTEGRNLQFCHRLVNFDLPWNPMEIEQRIGRLHRIGQEHPVRIFNFVQSGTLQEHLLQILQEKLNLFELVVGETGLVLGDRFGSDEFAEEILRRWRECEGRVAEALTSLGDELAAARDQYGEVKKLDETLFAKDYESL